MKAIFLSDAHVKRRTTRGYTHLMTFLELIQGNAPDRRSQDPSGIVGTGGPIAGVDDLYILGDFFDFWFSEGSTVHPEFLAILTMLDRLETRGIKIHICEGNHDFFLDEYFSERKNVEVIPEWATIDLDGMRVLISHGDTVDRKNKRYLFLRRCLRSPFFYRFHKLLPLTLRWKAAQIASGICKDLTEERTKALVMTMRQFSRKKFHESYDVVIMGHSHTPLIEEMFIDGRRKTFALLGDWIRHYSYLCYENGTFTLSRFQMTKD